MLFLWFAQLRRYTRETHASRPSGEEDSLKLIQYRFMALAFCYLFIVTTFLVMATITIQTADHFVKMIKLYFQCLKIASIEQCQEFWPINRFSQRSLGILIGVSSGLVCVANLVFLIPSKETRKVWQKWFRQLTCSGSTKIVPCDGIVSAPNPDKLIYNSKIV